MTVKLARLRIAALVAIACASSSALADDLYTWGTLTLSWAPPTQNVDGSELTDLLGYTVYMGDTPDTMVPWYFLNANTPSIVLTYRVGPGLRFFAVTAMNADGVESERSANAVKQLQLE
jgi:hypothetical protein